MASAAGYEYRDRIASAIAIHREALMRDLIEFGRQAGVLSRIARTMVAALEGGHTVLLAGNGGSAAEAQHFAAELVGRYKRERRPYAAIALSTDTSIITAIGNDYSYDEIFERQVRALGRGGDVLVALSTSGESRNLIRAAEAAQNQGVTVVAVTGPKPSTLDSMADLALRAPGSDTATVQELHMMFTHVICDVVEAEMVAFEADTEAGA